MTDHLHDPRVIEPTAEKYNATLVKREDDTEVVRFDHVTTRQAGQRSFVDLHMHLPGQWSLARAAALRANVEQALMAAVPGLRATIQLLPTHMEADALALPPDATLRGDGAPDSGAAARPVL